MNSRFSATNACILALYSVGAHTTEPMEYMLFYKPGQHITERSLPAWPTRHDPQDQDLTVREPFAPSACPGLSWTRAQPMHPTILIERDVILAANPRGPAGLPHDADTAAHAALCACTRRTRTRLQLMHEFVRNSETHATHTHTPEPGHGMFISNRRECSPGR
jgi:hypothetical protein